MFVRNSCRISDSTEKYCRSGQVTDDYIIRHRKYTTCMPDNLGKNTETHSEYYQSFITN